MSARKSDPVASTLTPTDLPEVFQRTPKVSVLHEAVVRHLANRRAGTADTKTRDEVAGGGRKPWRQKGTGRARQGSIRSPQWRKGGVVFGPHPRSHDLGMNRKSRRSALAMAIASKAQAQALFLVEAASLGAEKTKELAATLWPQEQGDRVLLVIHHAKDEAAPQIRRVGRNLRRADVADVGQVSAHAVLGHDRVILTRAALEALAEVCRA